MLVVKKIDYVTLPIPLTITNKQETQLTQITMSMTLELVAQRIATLESQMSALLETTNGSKKATKVKNPKKAKTTDTDSGGEQPAKKTRVSGYILFGKAIREDIKAELFTDGEKVKSSLVMTELGKRWKALNDDERDVWNVKAQELKAAE